MESQRLLFRQDRAVFVDAVFRVYAMMMVQDTISEMKHRCLICSVLTILCFSHLALSFFLYIIWSI